MQNVLKMHIQNLYISMIFERKSVLFGCRRLVSIIMLSYRIQLFKVKRNIYSYFPSLNIADLIAEIIIIIKMKC